MKPFWIHFQDSHDYPEIFFHHRHSYALPAHIVDVNVETWFNYIKLARTAKVFDDPDFQFLTDHILNVPKYRLNVNNKVVENNIWRESFVLAESVINELSGLIFSSLNQLVDAKLNKSDRSLLVKRSANISVILIRFISRLIKLGHDKRLLTEKLAHFTAPSWYTPGWLHQFKLMESDISLISFVLSFTSSIAKTDPVTFMKRLGCLLESTCMYIGIGNFPLVCCSNDKRSPRRLFIKISIIIRISSKSLNPKSAEFIKSLVKNGSFLIIILKKQDMNHLNWSPMDISLKLKLNPWRLFWTCSLVISSKMVKYLLKKERSSILMSSKIISVKKIIKQLCTMELGVNLHGQLLSFICQVSKNEVDYMLLKHVNGEVTILRNSHGNWFTLKQNKSDLILNEFNFKWLETIFASIQVDR